jgi:DNA-binding IclR family transcriptional regulator
MTVSTDVPGSARAPEFFTLVALGFASSDGKWFALTPRVLDGGDVVYVVRVPTTRIMTVSLGLGSRLPAYATSMGRVLLADLAPAELDAHLATVTLVLDRRPPARRPGPGDRGGQRLGPRRPHQPGDDA